MALREACSHSLVKLLKTAAAGLLVAVLVDIVVVYCCLRIALNDHTGAVCDRLVVIIMILVVIQISIIIINNSSDRENF